jgi:hypothetical protein
MYSPENEIYSSFDEKLNLKISFSFFIFKSFPCLDDFLGFVFCIGIKA